MATYILQSNPIVEVKIDAALPLVSSDLIYAGGGGTYFQNILREDSVTGGNQLHGGNPVFAIDESPVYKKCDKVILTKETIVIEGAPITRGLYVEIGTESSNLKADSSFLWDEIYSAPLGYYTVVPYADVLTEPTYSFGIDGNLMKIRPNDVNIVPKVGDYIVMQLVPTGFLKPTTAGMDGSTSGEDWVGEFSDGVNNFPVIKNTETYQFKIKEVTFENPADPGVTTYDYSFRVVGLEEDFNVLSIEGNTIDTLFTFTQGSADAIATIINGFGIGQWTAVYDTGVVPGSEQVGSLTFYSTNNTNVLTGEMLYNEVVSGNVDYSIEFPFTFTHEQHNPIIGTETIYTLVLDKSINVTTAEEYAIVLLNRENTGLQKELFYDTFEAVEIHKTQLLGDSFSNTSIISPLGRKNYINYNNAPYLGLRTLLNGVITAKAHQFLETPLMIFDIDEDIKDRFLPRESNLSDYTFEFKLPTLMLQQDTNNNKNILVNYSAIRNDVGGVGKYSGLYLKWDTTTSKRYGYIFYDLRLIVIDDSELVTALSYNSNRNYTLPKPIVQSQGNVTINLTSATNLNIIGLESQSGPQQDPGGPVGTNPCVIIVDGVHGLQTGSAITITGVRTIVPGSNLIHDSAINGVKYIKRYYTNPVSQTGERLDRFYLFDDAALSIGTIEEGDLVSNGLTAGNIKGATLDYNFFFTYRLKNNRYSSILPYANLTSFNFASTLGGKDIDNVDGSLFVQIPKLTYLNFTDVDGENAGYAMEDFEFIVGEWETANTDRPFEITGFKNVVVMSVQALTTPDLPTNSASSDFVIRKSDYNTSVAEMGNGLGAYDFGANDVGDPTYDLVNNMKHYDMTVGTLSSTLNTAQGKWTLGNVKYRTQVEQYRSKLSISIKADEWNDTTNPTYDPESSFMTSKYISEVAICDPSSDEPLIYAKIAPPIKKTADLDIILKLNLDW